MKRNMGRRKANPAVIPAATTAPDDAQRRGAQSGLRQQQLTRRRDAIFNLLLAKLPVTIFEYDVAADVMQYTFLNAGKKRDTRRIEHFRNDLLERQSDRPEMQESLQQLFDHACQPDQQGTAEYTAKYEKNEYRWYRSTYHCLEENDDSLWLVGYTEDINDAVLAHQQLVNSAQWDPLTKLYTKEATEKLIDHEIASLRPGEKGVLLYLDIDDFKQVNTRMGHMSGDGYLRAVTETLRSDFRDVDIFGRIGGDEFVVFFRGCLSIDIIEKRAQHIVDLFMHVQIENLSAISCSMGVAVTGSQTDTFAAMLPKAEKALNDARRRGRNRYRMYDEEHY